MPTARLLVFGKRWDATQPDRQAPWQLFELTGDGKRVPVPLTVPAFISEHELATYIADLLHEAVPTKGDDRVLLIGTSAGNA